MRSRLAAPGEVQRHTGDQAAARVAGERHRLFDEASLHADAGQRRLDHRASGEVAGADLRAEVVDVRLLEVLRHALQRLVGALVTLGAERAWPPSRAPRYAALMRPTRRGRWSHPL